MFAEVHIFGNFIFLHKCEKQMYVNNTNYTCLIREKYYAEWIIREQRGILWAITCAKRQKITLRKTLVFLNRRNNMSYIAESLSWFMNKIILKKTICVFICIVVDVTYFCRTFNLILQNTHVICVDIFRSIFLHIVFFYRQLFAYCILLTVL